MSDNDSYDLAEQCVVEQINDELKNEVTPSGSTVDVGDMQTCDCVPVWVTDTRQRRWNLQAVVWDRSELVATYEC